MNDYSQTEEASKPSAPQLALVSRQHRDEDKQAALYAALSRAQGAMSNASKDRQNPFLKSTYATLASVSDAIRKPFADNGLCHWAEVRIDSEARVVAVDVFVGHEGGGVLYAPMSGKFEDEKGLSTLQSMGKVITYLRRYGLTGLVGISQQDDDDDGASAPRPKKEEPKKTEPSMTVAYAESVIDGIKDATEAHKARVLLKQASQDGSFSAEEVKGLYARFTEKTAKLGEQKSTAADTVPVMGQK